MLSELIEILGNLMDKLKYFVFPAFCCSGITLLFETKVALFIGIESGELPSDYLFTALIIFIASVAMLLQMSIRYLCRCMKKMQNERLERKNLVERQQQTMQSFESLNTEEARFLLVSLRNGNQTFYCGQKDAVAMSLSDKGIVKAATDGHEMIFPFTIDTYVWNHLVAGREKWIEVLSKKCEK